jgi:hypothetical protein
MKTWSEKALAHHKARPRCASSRHKSRMNTRRMDFTKTGLLAPRAMTAVATPTMNRERLAEWV